MHYIQSLSDAGWTALDAAAAAAAAANQFQAGDNVGWCKASRGPAVVKCRIRSNILNSSQAHLWVTL
jgi:hypothetical protein